MTDCKHDWFFVNGTDDLKCKRCGEVTGPTPPEQLAQNMFKDIATMGSAWSQEGKRIDPWDVYKTTEYDTTQFYMPTGQLQVANFKPNYNLTFHNNPEGGTGKQVGNRLSFNNLVSNGFIIAGEKNIAKRNDTFFDLGFFIIAGLLG